MKNTVVTFKQAKEKGERISMLTAYDYSTAKLMDKAGINGILVGDSLGMVCLGYEDTISVTMEDMIHHSRAVARGCKDTLVVCDMPFMSYQTSVYDAVVNAGRLMKEGRAQAVKLEGGLEVCDKIEAIVKASIPVMGHIGLTPQSVNAFGGFKVQGKDEEAAKKLIESAIAIEKAGAFAIVLECVPAKLAKIISEKISIPTIGIGAGVNCDGQILVYQDMLGMYSDFTPKFVKTYEKLGEKMDFAFKKYIEEVKCGDFPEEKHSFKISDEVIEKLGEVDSENLIDIVSDRETLKIIIANFVENGIIEVIDENGEPFTSDEVLELLEGIPDSEEEYHECDVDEAQKMLDLKLSSLALSEEEDRLERLHDMSDLNTESDVVKEALEMANSYAVIVKTLVNQGINYSDAIILGNTYVSSKIEKEVREIDSIALKNNMV